MTVLLVTFLFLAFVGTDHVVRLASRRAAARRARPPMSTCSASRGRSLMLAR